MDNRVLYWPRGRVWGGSSSLNAMVYIRGHAEDYNRWQREGAEGWDYEHCLPYFRKAQCHELGENRYYLQIALFIWSITFYLHPFDRILKMGDMIFYHKVTMHLKKSFFFIGYKSLPLRNQSHTIMRLL